MVEAELVAKRFRKLSKRLHKGMSRRTGEMGELEALLVAAEGIVDGLTKEMKVIEVAATRAGNLDMSVDRLNRMNKTQLLEVLKKKWGQDISARAAKGEILEVAIGFHTADRNRGET